MQPNKDFKIEAILNSLEGMQHASLNPFFKTKLNAHLLKIEEDSEQGIFNYSWLIASFTCLLLFFNSYILFKNFATKNDQKNHSISFKESFKEAYHLNSTTLNYYDNY